MNTIQNTHERPRNKPSLKNIQTGGNNISNIRVIKDSFNDSIYAGNNLKDKILAQNSSRENNFEDDKHVNFSLENIATKSPTSTKKTNGLSIPLKQGTNVPKNFKLLAK